MKRCALALILLLGLAGMGAARYGETLITKKSGSTKVIVLQAATVYVYEPGATASQDGSATTDFVTYDCSNIEIGDTIQVESTGLEATVDGACTAGTFTATPALSYSEGDRFLVTSEEADIYEDEGLTTQITQPVTSDTSGRVLFWVDTLTIPTFDVLATTSVGGYRFVDAGVSQTGGAGGGGWTDGGATIYPTTITDKVAIGATSADSDLTLVCADAQSFNPADPDACMELQGDATDEALQIYYDSDGNINFYDDGESLHAGQYETEHMRWHLGDVEDEAGGGDAALRVRAKVATDRALIVEAATSQSANIAEFRIGTGDLKVSVDSDGDVTVPDLSATNLSATDVSTSTASITGDLTWNSIAYTPPSSGLGSGIEGIITLDDDENMSLTPGNQCWSPQCISGVIEQNSGQSRVYSFTQMNPSTGDNAYCDYDAVFGCQDAVTFKSLFAPVDVDINTTCVYLQSGIVNGTANFYWVGETANRGDTWVEVSPFITLSNGEQNECVAVGLQLVQGRSVSVLVDTTVTFNAQKNFELCACMGPDFDDLVP